jgi:hypothetical protein
MIGTGCIFRVKHKQNIFHMVPMYSSLKQKQAILHFCSSCTVVQPKFRFSQNTVKILKCFNLIKFFSLRQRELLRLYSYDIIDRGMIEEGEFVEYY